jgi:hypothetical protein
MSMFLRVAVSFCLLAGSSSVAVAQSLDADAIAFGTREGVSDMDLSPDGRHAVFVGPGPGRTSVVYHVDIARGSTAPIMSSTGNPETLPVVRIRFERANCLPHQRDRSDGRRIDPRLAHGVAAYGWPGDQGTGAASV